MEKAYGLVIPRSLQETCDPIRTALVVYDMQVGIVRQLQNGGEIEGAWASVIRGGWLKFFEST